jgi:diguanylate cyclase (GGDEF)-like protein
VQVQQALLRLPQTSSGEIEYRILHSNGEVRWLCDRYHVTYDAQGAPFSLDGIATDITERKQMQEQLIHDACHDALTGLPNRLLFMKQLAQAIARAKKTPDHLFAVLFLDLDRFKLVNDSLGHLVGDQLLVAIAHRLATCLRPNETIARLGGDEFTILLDGMEHVREATDLAERIHQTLQLPFSLNGDKVFTSASIGIALSIANYDSPEQVLRDADIALYHAKGRSKMSHAVFNTAMYNQAVALLQLETDLRWAIEQEQLCVYYQPIVSLETGLLAGFEALVRWQHPERGLIAPAEFIPLAEEVGLILPIGQWVLQEACQQLCRWQNQFPEANDLTSNVNLSSKQLLQPNLVEQVAQVLQTTQLNPAHLKLEITESGIIQTAEPIALLSQLKALQLQLCIDDFGTGYSSLSRLRQFPIDTLKIDRSFVSHMHEESENAEMVHAIISLAHNLGMDVVAEGIEIPAQFARLKALHCEQGLGYFFARPLDHKTATALIASSPRW